MKRYASKCLAPALMTAVFVCLPISAVCQVGAGLAVLTTGAVLDQAGKKAQEVIDSGTRSGDYLLARAGIESRIAIENARMASGDVIDTAMKDIDKERFNVIAGINQTLDDALRGALSGTQALSKAQEGVQQTAVILDGQGHRSYVIGYAPSVLFSNTSLNKQFNLRLRGVNLDEASATLTLSDRIIMPLTTGKQELLFDIPANLFRFDKNTPSVVTGKLRYISVKPGWFNRMVGNKEHLERDVVMLAQPTKMADFEYRPVISYNILKRTPASYPLPQFKGYDTDMTVAIAAPPGQEIDLSTLTFSPISGEGNSYCIGFVQAGQTKFGVTFQAHVGRIKRGLSERPGYINCLVAYDLTATSTARKDGRIIKGEINWFDDVPIKFEDGLESYALNIRTYDGRSRTFSAGGSDKFYRVTNDGTRLVITPRMPADFPEQ